MVSGCATRAFPVSQIPCIVIYTAVATFSLLGIVHLYISAFTCSSCYVVSNSWLANWLNFLTNSLSFETQRVEQQSATYTHYGVGSVPFIPASAKDLSQKGSTTRHKVSKSGWYIAIPISNTIQVGQCWDIYDDSNLNEKRLMALAYTSITTRRPRAVSFRRRGGSKSHMKYS